MPGLKLIAPSAGSNNIEFFNLGLLNIAAGAPDIKIPLFGRARDGDLTITSPYNPNTTRNSSAVGLVGTRSVDAPVAQVTAIDANATNKVLSVTAVFGALADFLVGDVVMLINQQGDSTSSGNVGNYELATVAATSSSTITLVQTVQRTYGPSNNAALGNQKIALYRVPEYNNITVTGVGLYPSAWNGIAGGCLPIMAQSLVCASGGFVSASQAGYRPSTVAGANGEGYANGINVVSMSSVSSGGGGGGVGLVGANASASPALVANTQYDCLSAGGPGGGGGGYGASGGAGGIGGQGGGGTSGMSLSAAASGGTLVNGGSQSAVIGASTGGAGGAGFAGYVPGGTTGYYGDAGAGAQGGASTQTAPGAGGAIGQAVLSQLLMGGAGGNAGAGANGGNGGNGGNITNNAALPNGNNEKRLGSGGGGGGGGGGYTPGAGGAGGTTGTNSGSVASLAGAAGQAGTSGVTQVNYSGAGVPGGGIALLMVRQCSGTSITVSGGNGYAGGYGGTGAPGVGQNTAATYRNAGGAGGGGAGGGGGGGGAGGTLMLICHNLVSITQMTAAGGIGGSGGVGGNGTKVATSAGNYAVANFVSGAGTAGSVGGAGAVGRVKVIFNWYANVNASAPQSPVDGPAAFTATTPAAFKLSL